MKLDVKRQLLARSNRVKGIDFHPTEPWILTTLYSGHVHIWSFETQQIVKTFELTDVPVRAGKFIARKSQFAAGSDDFQLRVYNYNTSEKITSFEAHPDYIRAIAVHPTQPFILTASDDMTIKLWDWEKGWKCVRVFEGHSHYVMGLSINPKDTNTFASACLDRTVKIWSLGSSTANSTIECHETKGVNSVEFYPGSTQPYLITTSDDRTIKVWDYTTKSLISSLEGHTNNVSWAIYHSELPVILSGSEDGTVRIWHANTYRFLQSLNYGLERAWCVATQKGKQSVALGFDDGAVVIKMGREEPAVSMDTSGKLIWAKNTEVVSAILKSDPTIKDSDPITLTTKELGTCEVYPNTLTHSPNGRFVALAGDGEYIIYTALAWRNKSFGQCLDFVWSKVNSNDYAIRESSLSVKIYKNFIEQSGGLDVGFAAEGLEGGVLLGVKGQGGISFFDWATGGLVRRIEVDVTKVYWSDSGELVALASEDTFYVLRFNRDAYVAAVQSGGVEDDGVEAAFEVITDISETVKSGVWVGDCFIYTNSTNRLSNLIGDQTYSISHFDQPMWILGYIQRDSRIYVTDKDMNVTSFALSLPVLEYQTLVLRGAMDEATELLPTIPEEQKNRVARFLEGQGLLELALEVATDPEHQFDLAITLNQLDAALQLAEEANVEHKWKTVGDAALTAWDVGLAAKCFQHAKDLSSLLLIYSSTADKEGLTKLAEEAGAAGANNVAFTANWLLGNISECVAILTKTGRLTEAVLFSQTYKPSLAREVVESWKQTLEKDKKGRVAKLIGVPGDDQDLFPEWEEWLKLESEGGTAVDNGEAQEVPEEAEEAAEEAEEAEEADE
ncbi:putative coatomer subunit beta [Thozetella sp. PMI_491]|nr:putative coatomer subunit beta [Thozetella sp. PMI_491]